MELRRRLLGNPKAKVYGTQAEELHAAWQTLLTALVMGGAGLGVGILGQVLDKTWLSLPGLVVVILMLVVAGITGARIFGWRGRVETEAEK